MATTTDVPGNAGGRGAGHLRGEAIPFTSICPKCQAQQLQRGFSRAALGRLLSGGYPIEAYCVACDDFWPINLSERVAIAVRLASFSCTRS
jgi:hypothetical protein